MGNLNFINPVAGFSYTKLRWFVVRAWLCQSNFGNEIFFLPPEWYVAVSVSVSAS